MEVSHIENKDRVLISSSKHDSIMAPVDVINGTCWLLRFLEGADHSLVPQRPKNKPVIK